ncbi:MAG: carbonic anhydrase [Lysobacterales bacterium]|jgi:carbonic anhydrase
MNAAYTSLERLKEGNRRFAQESQSQVDPSVALKRSSLVAGQNPFAIILGCSDSRVPAEIVFDQGLGDLFVIRVAGNIVAPSQIGSVEFAATQFGISLVVVMGHSDCGAVSATIDALQMNREAISPSITMIVNRIRPAVEPLLTASGLQDKAQLMDDAVRANIAASVKQLAHGSEILENLIMEDRLLVIGAEYCLQSGLVEFFEESSEC